MTKAFRMALAAVVPLVLLAAALPALSEVTSVGPVTGSPREPGGIAVHSGSIVLKVPDYNDARSRVMQLASARQALVHEEKSQANFAGERHGSISLELDAAQLGPLMDDVRRVGKLYSERVETTDQTSDYQKLERQIVLLKQNEGELLGFLHSPRHMRGSDILFVQYRLFQSRVQAANAAQARADMERRARGALIRVDLFEPEPRKSFDWGNWHALATYRAKGSFLFVTRKVVTALYFVLYFAPFWIPALLIGYFGGRKLVRWAGKLDSYEKPAPVKPPDGTGPGA